MPCSWPKIVRHSLKILKLYMKFISSLRQSDVYISYALRLDSLLELNWKEKCRFHFLWTCLWMISIILHTVVYNYCTRTSLISNLANNSAYSSNLSVRMFSCCFAGFWESYMFLQLVKRALACFCLASLNLAQGYHATFFCEYVKRIAFQIAKVWIFRYNFGLCNDHFTNLHL